MAKNMNVTVNKRVSLGGGTYQYTGTLVATTAEYEAGGNTLTQPTSGPTLPEQVEFMQITPAGGYSGEYVPKSGATAAKVKMLGTGAAAKAALIEAGNVDMSALTFRFLCVGA